MDEIIAVLAANMVALKMMVPTLGLMLTGVFRVLAPVRRGVRGGPGTLVRSGRRVLFTCPAGDRQPIRAFTPVIWSRDFGEAGTVPTLGRPLLDWWVLAGSALALMLVDIRQSCTASHV